MEFEYKALDKEGNDVTDTATAASKAELYDSLKAEGLTLLTAQKVGEREPLFNRLSRRVEQLTGRVKEREKILFARNLGAMIKAGLPVSRALGVIHRQATNLTFQSIVADLQEKIREGSSFHDALADHDDVFSPLFIAMVEAGEESGNLAETLRNMSDQMDRAFKLKRRIKGALMYPAVIIVAMIIIAVLMLVFVVPTLTSTFVDLGVDLPASTQFIISMSSFLSNHSLVALVGTVLFIALVVYALRTPQGKRIGEKVVLSTPVVGTLVKETNAARTTSTLSSLLAAGVDVVRSIEITRNVVQNSHYKEILSGLHEKIQKGVQMSEVFRGNEDLYPAFVGEMVLVGEETGDLPGLLREVAAFYEEDVEQKTQDLSTIIEPVLMIVVGAGVGFFAISMITPMYSLTSTL